ncbi:leucine-rich repeat domain-containing protein [Halosquirtibacter xylanolyticus]|uniref:leucine-rich repeat domain-containing protein n=1 Tax=Halosquirtibacter xylanolyticus TaxID=3374599 RepID=UPI0037489592|nr:leucine-rich repeat domain-containing protein [Prolixibacteraceae bacterium]
MMKKLYTLLLMMSLALSGWAQDRGDLKEDPSGISLGIHSIPQWETERYQYDKGDIHVRGIKLVRYIGSDNREGIKIPSEVPGGTVVAIGSNVFKGVSMSKGPLQLPEGLGVIEDDAFNGCYNFTGSIVIPSSVQIIGKGAFERCTGFDGVLHLGLYHDLKIIGKGAFKNCTGLKEIIDMPLGLTNIGPEAFQDCSGLRGVVNIPGRVKKIEPYTFGYCSALEGVRLAEGVKEIQKSAFLGCSNLSGYLYVPSSITAIGDASFMNCVRLEGITFADFSQTASLGHLAFIGCTSLAKINSLSNKITKIGAGCFARCSQLTKDFVFPNGLKELGYGAFSETEIKNFTFPNGVTDISFFTKEQLVETISHRGDRNHIISTKCYVELLSSGRTFCSTLDNVTFGENVTSIESGMFNQIQNIATITSNNPIVPTIEKACFNKDIYSKSNVVVKDEKAYAAATGWKEFESLKKVVKPDVWQVEAYEYNKGSIHENGVKVVTYNGSFDLSNLVIPDMINGQKVLAIGQNLFASNIELKGAVTLPTTLRVIEDNAFSDCSNISGSISIPASVISIGNGAFTGCSNNNFVIEAGSKLQEIGVKAFHLCSSMTGNLILPQSLTKIGQQAFFACSGLTGNLTIPASVHEIGALSFAYCSSLEGSLTLSEGVEQIKDGAFLECSSLSGTLTIPSTVHQIETGAFMGCFGLTRLEFASLSNLTQIGHMAFASCGQLSGTFDLPNSVAKIGGAAFFGCMNLPVDITLPTGIEALGFGAFEATKLSSVTIPDGVTRLEYIDKSTFEKSLNENILGDFFTQTLVFKNLSAKINTFPMIMDKVIMGSDLNSLDLGLFNNCPNIRKIESRNTTPPAIHNDFFSSQVYRVASLTVPTPKQYATANGWKRFEALKSVLQNSNWETEPYVFDNGTTHEEGLKVTGYSGKQVTDDFTIPNTINGKPVLAIGDLAFSYSSKIKGRLILPNRLRVIEDQVFSSCRNLTGDLTIPATVVSIGLSSFKDCTGLSGQLIFENGSQLKTIKYKAFKGCANMTGSINLPSSLEIIAHEAFQDCIGFTGDLTIPSGVSKLEPYSFGYCTGLNGTLTISEGVEIIQKSAFLGSTNLTGTLHIPASITEIGDVSFLNCKNITALTFAAGSKLTKIGHMSFAGCASISGTLEIPTGVTEIGGGAYSGCSALADEVILPNTLQKLSFGVFHATNITSLTIPDGVKRVEFVDKTVVKYLVDNRGDKGHVTGTNEYNALFNQDSSLPNTLKNVTFGNSVVSIDTGIFDGCTKITAITSANPLPPRIEVALFTSDVYANAKLDVPSKITYAKATGWSEFASLKTVVTPSFAWKTEAYTYDNGSIHEEGLKITGFTGTLPNDGLAIPNQINGKDVLAIGDRAFSESAKRSSGAAVANALKGEVIFPNKLRVIEDFAFDNCIEMTGAINIPSTVASIGAYAFCQCTGINGPLNFGDNSALTLIDDEAFHGCTRLSGSLTIPAGVERVGEFAFSQCKGLNGVLRFASPSKIKTIDNFAFYYCQNIRELIIGDQARLETVGLATFAGCYNMGGFVSFLNHIKVVGPAAFYSCGELRGDLVIPNTIKSIGFAAFASCPYLSDVTFQEGITSIDYKTRAYMINEVDDYGIGFGEKAYKVLKFCVGQKTTFYETMGTLHLPSTLTEVPAEIFDGLWSIDQVICDAVTPPTLYNNSFDMSMVGDILLTVPNRAISDYRAHALWSQFRMGKISTDVNLSTSADVKAYVKDGVIHIDNADDLKRVEAFNILGIKLYEHECNSTTVAIPCKETSLLLIRLTFKDGSVHVLKR